MITSRSDHLRPKLEAWIGRYFPGAFKSICFSNQSYGDNDRKRKKSEICAELGIEVFVDDALHYARDVAESGTPVLLLDAPWNQPVNITLPLPANVIRVHDWKEIVEAFTRTSKPLSG